MWCFPEINQHNLDWVKFDLWCWFADWWGPILRCTLRHWRLSDKGGLEKNEAASVLSTSKRDWGSIYIKTSFFQSLDSDDDDRQDGSNCLAFPPCWREATQRDNCLPPHGSAAAGGLWSSTDAIRNSSILSEMKKQQAYSVCSLVWPRTEEQITGNIASQMFKKPSKRW